MFQMECQNCRAVINSPLLVELRTIECLHCQETVKVKDVIVSTKSFSIQRNDLLNRIPLYKKLLREVEKELQEMKQDDKVSNRSENSVLQFRALLKDLLLGARDNFRLDMPCDLFIEVGFDNKKRLARLINLSSKGAAVEFVGRGDLPQNNSAINLHLLLPGHAESLSLHATVAWIRKPTREASAEHVNMGLQFSGLDKKTHDCVWDFIVSSEFPAHAKGEPARVGQAPPARGTLS